MGTARGKVILLGEHAVVHGHPALAGAISRGVEVDTAGACECMCVAIASWDMRARAGDGSAVGVALAAIAAAAGVRDPVRLAGDADLPAAVGLGSSAALSVAIARALAPGADTAAIESLAMAGERAFHKTPSGVDVAVSARGGLGLFARDVGFEAVPAPPVPLCIGLSSTRRQTAAMVAGVRARLEASPRETEATLCGLGELAQSGAAACGRGDLSALGEMMDRAHAGLGAIGVSTDELNRMVAIAKGAGALGAKLTGGGGGGAVIALGPGREDAVLASWREAGFSAFMCEVGPSMSSG